MDLKLEATASLAQYATLCHGQHPPSHIVNPPVHPLATNWQRPSHQCRRAATLQDNQLNGAQAQSQLEAESRTHNYLHAMTMTTISGFYNGVKPHEQKDTHNPQM
jgi:hypothetical protein